MISIFIGVGIAVLIAALYASKRIGDLIDENRRLLKLSDEIRQMKKDFISYVSHELKAPLASMQETTQLLLERIPGPLTDKQKRLLELNLQSGKRLARMIGNLLDLSQLEAGIIDYDMQEQDVGEIVRNTVQEHNATLAQGQAAIRASIPTSPVVVSCDFGLMTQLLQKILENAVHVSNQSGGVRVLIRTMDDYPPQMPETHRVALENGSEGFVLISVADSGPGIEDSQKQKVFEVFHQVGRRGRIPTASLGLGLPLARALAQGHRGAIWVEDNPLGGSIFQVLLPRTVSKPQTLRRAS